MPSLACTPACPADPLHLRDLPCLSPARAGALYHAVRAVESVPGAVAEVGGYRGDTAHQLARVLAHVMPQKLLHVFEGFHGLPARGTPDDAVRVPLPPGWQVGSETGTLALELGTAEYMTTPAQFWRTIAPWDAQVRLHAGWFHEQLPDFGQPLCLAHIDADLYASTVIALGYCAPLIVPGGVLIIDDDQSEWTGVTRAVDAWLATHRAAWVIDRDAERRSCIAWKRG